MYIKIFIFGGYFSYYYFSRVAWQVPLMEQELHTFPEHLSSASVLVEFMLLNL
jgi:Na+/proline symporter